MQVKEFFIIIFLRDIYNLHVITKLFKFFVNSFMVENDTNDYYIEYIVYSLFWVLMKMLNIDLCIDFKNLLLLSTIKV